MEQTKLRDLISSGKCALGIELGSTRIKAVLIDEYGEPVAGGGYSWENSYVDQVWTYSLEEIHRGLAGCYADLSEQIMNMCGEVLTRVRSIGVSAMMHGYMAFDESDELLVPFRTWRNTMTLEASNRLSEAFSFHIPQRWSIAHLYQAILNGEAHVPRIRFMTTLAGYIHWQLTGEKVLGVGDASGMFPIEAKTCDYNSAMLRIFDELSAKSGFEQPAASILPRVLCAGDAAGTLTEKGARLLDASGKLEAGIPLCPPEGDAGTGMAATNSVRVRTGNVSAGTSVFSMVVLEKELSKPYEEIDMVTTPSGEPVAMVHCNNCTSDLNAWVSLFGEFARDAGLTLTTDELYGLLYRKALEADPDGGGLTAYNYLSGEHIPQVQTGRPLFTRPPEAKFNLANFMRTHLFTSLGALKWGMDILLEQESVGLDKIYGHGGLFKTRGVGQRFLAGAIRTPVYVMETAGEGGAWGIALLAAYMVDKKENESLADYLDGRIFSGISGLCEEPCESDAEGFSAFMERYKAGICVEKLAGEVL